MSSLHVIGCNFNDFLVILFKIFKIDAEKISMERKFAKNSMTEHSNL